MPLSIFRSVLLVPAFVLSTTPLSGALIQITVGESGTAIINGTSVGCPLETVVKVSVPVCQLPMVVSGRSTVQLEVAAGDVKVSEGIGAGLSDLLRLIDNGNGGATSFALFSDTGQPVDGDPADVGLPTAFQAVLKNLTEGIDTPLVFTTDSTNSLNSVQFTIVSDADAPEPSTGILGLLSAGALLIAGYWRRLRS